MQLRPPAGGGKAGDDAGHIIAANLGGPGAALWNFFPQSSNINRGQWAQQEAICANELRLGHSVRVCFQFHYGDATHPRRPSAFDYCYKLADGTRLADNLVNP
jgi:DNA/RNA endonuclease G (NUC1)